MQPQYKISGRNRRIVKKELSKLKEMKKMFWHYDNIDKDFTEQTEDSIKEDEIANNRYNEILLEIIELENKLSEKL
jgi:hypothetical protein